MKQHDTKNGDAVFFSGNGKAIIRETIFSGSQARTRDINTHDLDGIEQELNDRMIEALKTLDGESTSLTHSRLGELELAAEYAEAVSMFYLVRSQNIRKKATWARDLVAKCRRESILKRILRRLVS